MGDIADLIDAALSGGSAAYREGRAAPYQLQLLRQKAQRGGLENQTIQSTLDDLTRERAERAAAPGAAARLMSAYQPQAPTTGALTQQPQPGEDEEGAAFLPRTQSTPGRSAARTLPDLLSRGVSAEDYDLAAKYRPNAVTGLGLMTPENAAKATAEANTRTRLADLTEQISQAVQSGDTAKARTLNAVLAAAKGDPKDLNVILGNMEAAPEGEAVDLEKGTKRVTTTDTAGMRRTREAPLSEGEKITLHTDRMVALIRKAEGGQSLTPAEQQQYKDSWRFVNTVRPSQLQPGAYTVPRGPLDAAPPGGSPSAAAVGPNGPAVPQGAYRGVPPTASASETKEAADAQTWIKQAREAADHLDGYLKAHPEASERMSYAARIKMQGMPYIGAMEWTSPEEQKLAASIGNLQLAWERASGGLRMASSPQMQERIRSIFGNPTNAATPNHLRTVAGQMEQEIQQRAETERQAGRRPIATPQGAPAPGTPPATGLDTVRAANAIAQREFGKPYGNLGDAERRAIFERVKKGEQ